MVFEMEGDLPEFDPHDARVRERFRRHGKRRTFPSISQQEDSSSSKSAEARLFFNGHNIQRRPNAALFLEEIKQEIENYEVDDIEMTPGRMTSASKKRVSVDGRNLPELDQLVSPSLKPYKHGDDVSTDTGETAFTLFASLLESALQGLIPFPDLILQFENTCRNMSELMRDEASGRHRIVEDKLMRQKSKLLIDEAATWSLLWYLFGKGNEDIPESLILSPSSSHQEACQFVMADHTAQLCLRIVQWLEGLTSKVLDMEKKVRGWHVGSYLHNSGLWHRTERLLKKGACDSGLVQHLDFDAPTREDACLLPEDKKQEDSLLEDIWILLRAGRLEEACELCRSAGQPWRTGTLCLFGGLDQFPSVEALTKTGKSRALQATELESGIGFQRRLWKWACFCASEKIAEQDGGKYEAAVFAVQCSNVKRVLPICKDWESACWAMTKSWLDCQIDLELARLPQSRAEQTKSNEDSFYGISRQGDQSMNGSIGTEMWPCQVLDQQPHDFHALLRKLHSGEMVHESVSHECRDQHRQIQMGLMLGDVAHLLDLLKSWISPLDNDDIAFRPCGDPQLVRFGAHLVLILRYLMADDMKDAFKEKLVIAGNFILYMYAVYLFSQNHEELVGVYASQLAPHLCVDLFVRMMELRMMASVHVKYKIFRSAMEYLPFLDTDTSKGCFEDILERVLSRSRDITSINSDEKSHDAMGHHQSQTIQKAMVVQWLCFTPPTTVSDCEDIKARLLKRALAHSIMLFREFSLISMRRTPKMPVGAHMLLGFLAEPLQQLTETLLVEKVDDISEDMAEFWDWQEFYSCDASYRRWLEIELENAAVPSHELTEEEREKAHIAAKETLDTSLDLLQNREVPWLVESSTVYNDPADHVFLELHATLMLCLPTGECVSPDATLCTVLTSALYSSVSEEIALSRQLLVNVAVSSRDQNFIEAVIRCLAINGDGLEQHQANDGGLLANVIAAGFKGELARFQVKVTLEISQLDAWYTDDKGSFKIPAPYIVRGLCRRCCLPEIILRCMQVYVSLAESGNFPSSHSDLIDLVASSHTALLPLFSPLQLQEFLLFEREYTILHMTAQEDSLTSP